MDKAIAFCALILSVYATTACFCLLSRVNDLEDRNKRREE